MKDRSKANQVKRRREINRSSMKRTQSSRLRNSTALLAEVKLAAYDREGGHCAICNHWPATEFHHRLPRGMGGASRSETIHSLSSGIWICSHCHSHLERDDRSAAYALGYLLRHGVRTAAEIPLLYRGRLALLTDEGDINYVEDAS